MYSKLWSHLSSKITRDLCKIRIMQITSNVKFNGRESNEKNIETIDLIFNESYYTIILCTRTRMRRRFAMRLSICGKLSLNASITSEARDYSVMDHSQHLRTIHREYAIDIEAYFGSLHIYRRVKQNSVLHPDDARASPRACRISCWLVKCLN